MAYSIVTLFKKSESLIIIEFLIFFANNSNSGLQVETFVPHWIYLGLVCDRNLTRFSAARPWNSQSISIVFSLAPALSELFVLFRCLPRLFLCQ